MSSLYVPGPWAVKSSIKKGTHDVYAVIDGAAVLIATIPKLPGKDGYALGKYTALLIAVAPDTYEASKGLVTAVARLGGDGRGTEKLEQMALNAIARVSRGGD